MGLPDFLIIGAQKSGTTWLYNVLKSHQEIEMAVDRKEVHFFDRYYDRGINWYEGKFPKNSTGVIGEATPAYLYRSECPSRIAKVIPKAKLICILRNPINRAYSHYKYLVQEQNCQQDFSQIVKEKEDILKRGLYYKQLNNYLKFFNKKNIKVLIFEELVNNKEEKIKEICDFLNVSYSFNKKVLYNASNVSKVPKFRLLYSLAKSFVRKLYDYDLVFIINLMKKIGMKKIFFSNKKKNKFSKMTNKTKKKLKKYYYNDIIKLENLLEKSLKDIWNFN